MNFTCMNMENQQTQKGDDQQTGVIIDAKTQSELNQPPDDPTGVNQEDKDFLANLLALVEEGKIDLHRPSTLINSAVYDSLPSEKQGRADLSAMNILNSIRNIKDLYDHDFENTYQIQNLVRNLRLNKEQIEVEGGDLFII